MRIGISKERGLSGYERAVLLPEEIKKIVRAGHKVFVEKGIGEDIYIEDSKYRTAGAQIVSEAKDIFAQPFVVKLTSPSDNEFLMMKNNILLSMFHAGQNQHRVKFLQERKIKAFAMECIETDQGERLVDATDITGEQALIYGYNLTKKSPHECSVLILGYGRIATGALKVVMGLNSRMKILRKSEYKDIRHHLKGKDILVNGIHWPKYHRERKDYVVTRSMLKLMNPGAIVVDISVDYPSPIETCKPTMPNDPWYEIDGVKHVCVYGYPSLAPISCSRRYSKQVLPLVLELARKKGKDLSKPLQNGFIKIKDYIG